MKFSSQIVFRTLLASAFAVHLAAQVVVTPSTPQIGSSNPASPEPPLARPTTTPCVVPLLSDVAFANFDPFQFTYTPPSVAGCSGPWAKVILTADFTVTAGRQYDRTAKFFLGGVNIYFGTTAEPRATLSPSWHIERDVTDLSVLFKTAQTGYANIGNLVNSTYTGIIYASSSLLFYPADTSNPAPEVPSLVLSLTSANDSTFVNSTTDAQKGTFTFPRNVERAYLDVIAQAQANDEFWYTCVPSDVANALQNCGNSAFRETQIAIDGTPAGVAPIYPWIYTGGIDPYLWEPVPGVETLNFKPYRVNLTPFAGLLSDGKPHTVSVSVFNANSGFALASTLLLYQDTGASVITGEMTANTLTAVPSPRYEHYLNTAADGTVSGPVNVYSHRSWTIAGYVNTSHGRVDTAIEASNSFQNLQDDKTSNSSYKQSINQETTQQEITTISSTTGTIQLQHDVDYPLIVFYNQAPNSDGSITVANYVKQRKIDALRAPFGANSSNPIVSQETVETADTLFYNSAGSFVGHSGNATGSFSSKDAQQNCFYRSVTSKGVTLIATQDSTSCSLAP